MAQIQVATFSNFFQVTLSCKFKFRLGSFRRRNSGVTVDSGETLELSTFEPRLLPQEKVRQGSKVNTASATVPRCQSATVSVPVPVPVPLSSVSGPWCHAACGRFETSKFEVSCQRPFFCQRSHVARQTVPEKLCETAPSTNVCSARGSLRTVSCHVCYED